MCGICGYIGSKKNASAIVLKGLKQLEYRGYDSWGVVMVADEQLLVEKHLGKIGSGVLKNDSATSCAIGHTRWATHGGVTIENTHPHLDDKREIALVHNGIIENYQELRELLKQKGYQFLSETDTEVAVHLIAEYKKRFAFDEAVRRAFQDVKGLNAWVVIDLPSQQLIAVRNGSPLTFGKDTTGFYIASDAAALSEYTDQVYFLEDGDLLSCEPATTTLSSIDSMQPKRIVWQRLDVTTQDLDLGDNPHFMIKEILEQPKVLQNIIDSSRPAVALYANNLDRELAFVGCGSAYHAALIGSYFFSLIAKKRCSAYVGSEFPQFRQLFEKDGFVTFLSQSGETIDLLESVNVLKKQRLPFGAIVNRLGSSLERSTENKLLLGAGPEQCVLATKSFTAKIALLFLLAHEGAGSFEQGKKELISMQRAVADVLSTSFIAEFIRPLATKLTPAEHLFIVGRGASYPVALEAALKIKEVTYIHTEGFAGGELKHGVIALIESGSPCIFLAPKDETYQSMVSTAIEIKSRGGWTIALTDESNEVFDDCLLLRHTGLSTAITQSIVMQLLAYEIALNLGRDPDKPRNLAKSVTVK